MAESKRKGRGGKLARSEVVQVRLDPKLRFTAELAAAKERRTLSSFIEWAVERAVNEVQLWTESDGSIPAAVVADRVWDVDEADRFANTARYYPELLTHEEMRKWKFIREVREFWLENKRPPGWGQARDPVELNLPAVRAAWGLIDEHIANREPFDWNRFVTITDERRIAVESGAFPAPPLTPADDPDIPF